MTQINGVRISATPCCGARYAQPRYASMNFSAWEYWTDGWREGSLMPNDDGLRRCRCGRFLLAWELVEIATSEASDLPRIEPVGAELLPKCIAQAGCEDMELAARLGHWRHLNHAYRERYREHRDAEEAATQAAWMAANPDRRTWWDRLLRRQPRRHARPPGSPFTCPPFEPTDEQWGNLQRLGELLHARGLRSRRGPGLELAEVYREQARFEDAQAVIAGIAPAEGDVTKKLLADLIARRWAGPVRYRL